MLLLTMVASGCLNGEIVWLWVVVVVVLLTMVRILVVLSMTKLKSMKRM